MLIDLRSDTITKPTAAMLEAMFNAKVGDDVLEEDQTINALQEKAADLFGMDAALFCPSGTMTNQIAIKCHTQPMDEVICDETAHVYRYEGGGMMFNSGVSVKLLTGDNGRINADLIEEHINHDDIHYPKTSLVVLENTVNRGGGSVYTMEMIEPIYHLCKLKNLKLHLDGARLFNALAVTKDKPKEYGEFFDSISICLSKGLGAPVGSLLLGNDEFISQAKRVRKVLGGGMRQAGFLAAAGIYALDNHIERLVYDHENAKRIASALSQLPFVNEIKDVETNIIIFEMNEQKKADQFQQQLKEKGILCNLFGKQMIRFVTHLDLTESHISKTIEIINSFK